MVTRTVPAHQPDGLAVGGGNIAVDDGEPVGDLESFEHFMRHFFGPRRG